MDIKELLERETRTNIENWCRSRTQNCSMGGERGDAILCRVLGKYLMFVPNTDRSISPHLIMDGYWEMWITMAIARFVQPGTTCIDVGANVGYYSVLMADIVGAKGHVYAIEPVPLLAMEANLEKLGSGNWTALRYAASDHTGTADLAYFRQHVGDCTLHASAPSHPGDTKRVLHVATAKLDDLVTTPVDFIKMDVEGHEPAVWRGARELIARSPKLQVAAEWTRGYDPEAQIVMLAQEDGFALHEVHTDGTLRKVTIDEVRQGAADWRMLWFKK